MNDAPFRDTVLDKEGRLGFSWVQWMQKIGLYAQATSESGTTANRPVVNLYVGRPYFDTTLGKPIWVQSLAPTVWCDATGASV